MSAIRGWNIAVGVVTAVVGLIGIHAGDSVHASLPFPPAYSPPAAFSVPTQGPIPGIGHGIVVSPIPFPTLALPKLRLVTSIIVQQGDSLSSLACRYQTTVGALQEMNHLGTSTFIAAGQRLLIPLNYERILGC